MRSKNISVYMAFGCLFLQYNNILCVMCFSYLRERKLYVWSAKKPLILKIDSSLNVNLSVKNISR